MKLSHYLLLTYGCVAAFAATFSAAAMTLDHGAHLLAAVAAVNAATLTVVAFAHRRIANGLQSFERALADFRVPDTTGIKEFDAYSQRLAQDARHWASVAGENRAQSREFESMIAMLEQNARENPTSADLRNTLNALGQSLHDHMDHLTSGGKEIEQLTKSIADGAESQSHSVIRTSSYIDQLLSTIETVTKSATNAQSEIQHTEKTAQNGLALLEELSRGMQSLQLESKNCEKNIRALHDPTRQVTAMVSSISDIAARTDLLALNASIESIRAGEHGRGFAVVAEEVRRLAEQTAEATHEINALLDTMQIATQESMRGIAREREQVESGVHCVKQAEQNLREITRLGEEARTLSQISEAATHQQQLTQDVVAEIGKLSELAKANRADAENAGWTVKSIGDRDPRIVETIGRLRNCGQDIAVTSHQSFVSQDESSPASLLHSVN